MDLRRPLRLFHVKQKRGLGCGFGDPCGHKTAIRFWAGDMTCLWFRHSLHQRLSKSKEASGVRLIQSVKNGLILSRPSLERQSVDWSGQFLCQHLIDRALTGDAV
ncbi:MAG: hypothetical protein RLZZ157_1672 [Pseudomonadota bacterium]